MADHAFGSFLRFCVTKLHRLGLELESALVIPFRSVWSNILQYGQVAGRRTKHLFHDLTRVDLFSAIIKSFQLR